MTFLVVDTNVLLSALLSLHPQSPSLQVVAAILTGRLQAAVSPALLAEYSRILLRPDVASRHRRSRAEIDRLLVDFAMAAIVAYPSQSRQPAPDPGDQHLWDLLAEVPDAVLVTGDTALRQSNHFPGRILTPREFVERYDL